jgi:hypothetical protein
MISQPLSVSNRDKQVPKALQVWLFDKTRDGIVSDHDPAQIYKPFSTIACHQAVQMVEMGMGESEYAYRGRINTCLGHRSLEMTQRWLPPSASAAIDQNAVVSGLLQQKAIDRQSNE